MSFRAGIIVLIFGGILALGVGLRSCVTEDDEAGGKAATSKQNWDGKTDSGSDLMKTMPSKLPRSEPEPSAHAYIRRKLESIIIPVIAFEDTTLEEAIDFLRVRSIELDKEEADPSRKGISFLIAKPHEDADSHSVDSLQMPEDARAMGLTMEARDISLWDALHRIAREAGLKVEITDRGIELQAP